MSGLSASKDLRPNGRTNRGLVSAAAPEVSELDAIIGTRDQVLAAIKLQEWWRSRQQHKVSAEEDEEDATVADGETSAPAADAEMTADELQEIIRNKLLAAEGALRTSRPDPARSRRPRLLWPLGTRRAAHASTGGVAQ